MNEGTGPDAMEIAGPVGIGRVRRGDALLLACYSSADSRINPLTAPSADVCGLEKILKDPRIGNFNVKVLVDETSYSLRKEIETFFSDRKREEMLLLYFSGHGIKDKNGKLYFATSDTRLDRLKSTAISASDVREIMSNCSSRRQVLILDCCYGGAFNDALAKGDKMVGISALGGMGRIVLTASDAIQSSFEDGGTVDGVQNIESKRSIFTKELIHGLESGEADLERDGCVSVGELYSYLYDRVSSQMPEMRPQIWDMDGCQGKVIVANNPESTSEFIGPDGFELHYQLTQRRVYCIKCGNLLHGDAMFCNNCGANRNSIRCPLCSKVLSPGAHHCSGCGIAISRAIP